MIVIFLVGYLGNLFTSFESWEDCGRGYDIKFNNATLTDRLIEEFELDPCSKYSVYINFVDGVIEVFDEEGTMGSVDFEIQIKG